MEVQIFQKGRRNPLTVEDLKKIQYFSIAKDDQQTLDDNFSSFSLNNVVSEVKFIGMSETVIIRAEEIESIVLDEGF
ncbi:hypothetical protein [Limosilactobacillus mucosae]|uniref:hypothetical protein n=1 Tax=Limosilactobacillus mucosae TaxID=97478 RepID=UPI000FFB7480|nr:hypothetical protein [Limosilactobacillus mucosae]RXA55781.1 hypothetical protein EQ839_08495 [Limosilactobacillus mucosae]